MDLERHPGCKTLCELPRHDGVGVALQQREGQRHKIGRLNIDAGIRCDLGSMHHLDGAFSSIVRKPERDKRVGTDLLFGYRTGAGGKGMVVSHDNDVS